MDKINEYQYNRMNYNRDRFKNPTYISLLVLFFISLFVTINQKSAILLTVTVIIFIIYLFYTYKLRQDYGL